MAIYVDTTDGPPGPHGVWIDAFDVNRGDFVDDPFVGVQPDEGLTKSANDDGFVPTQSTQHVVAFTGIHYVPFAKWDVVIGVETVSERELNADAGTDAVAFAFYQLPATPQVNTGRTPEAGLSWVSWGVKVDGGGPTSGGPVPPWDPLARQIAAGLALAAAAANVSPMLRAKVLELAIQQVTIGTQDVTKAIEQEIDPKKR